MRCGSNGSRNSWIPQGRTHAQSAEGGSVSSTGGGNQAWQKSNQPWAVNVTPWIRGGALI